MKQFSYEIYDTNDMEESLRDVRQYLNTHKASAVLAHLYAGYTERGRLELVIGTLKEIVPEAMVVGATAGGEIRDGVLVPQTTLLVIDVFHKTKVEVSQFWVMPGEEATYGDSIRNQIDGTNEIKAAELIVDCADISTAVMFPVINRCSSRVKIFGAVPYAHNVKNKMFVFTGESLKDVTVILITYAGKEFHVSTDYVIGWKPMGISMQVTRSDGSILNELDGEPALSVYEKYLQIPNDEHFYENAFEFPFLRYINDTYMMRLPFLGLEDGSIELRAPIDEGDIMYLSYGDVSTILAEVYEARGRLERFHPQYIRLHNCATRKGFWGKDVNREIEPFRHVTETAGFYTGGEVLRVNGELVHFNATLVIIGMREGAPDPKELLRISESDRDEELYSLQTSMVRRMAHFINVAMQELLESNRQLGMLAVTDELTGLPNRREMNRIIESYHNTGTPYALLMADLDDFKKINDTYGHDTGDITLQEIAGVMADSVKNVRDAVCGRWGGEEFMILLPRTDSFDAEKTAEKLRRNIEKHRFKNIKKMTVSLGVTDSGTFDDMKVIYHDVDQALYAAKNQGKNCVVTSKGIS